MKNEYDWSESGRELLLVFELLVRGYGGAEKLAHDIEVSETFNKPTGYAQWDFKTTLFMLKNLNSMPIRNLSTLINKTPGAIAHKVRRLREKGLITNTYSFSANEFLTNNFYINQLK